MRVPARASSAAILALALAACSGGGTIAPGTPEAPASAGSSATTATEVPGATAISGPQDTGSSAPQPSASCATAARSTADLGRLARAGPSSGVWVGMNLDWGSETVADVTGRLGSPPATVVSFVSFPFTSDDGVNLQAAAGQAREAGAILIVTLQPWGGLAAVTPGVAEDLATRLARFGADGVPTIVRFAHEMNGSWYPWGQDPAAYVAAFRRVADAVHASAPTAAMLWAPNQGDGYPYAGGQYQAKPGTPAIKPLDTNGDGRVDAADDPYAPYWPGSAYVDWVGMSLYHWGTTYPWGANTIPAAGKFAQMVSGSTPPSAERVPDFYAGYAERYAKPLAIVETAALYRPGGGGAAESAIKTAWLAQVFSADTRTRFPLLRIVNWFEWRKIETEVHAVVDWRITVDPGVRTSFLAAMSGGFHLGPAVSPPAASPGCSPQP